MTPRTKAAQFYGPAGSILEETRLVNASFAEQLEIEYNNEVIHSENQAVRIRYLEGATNHATGTPLSLMRKERDKLQHYITRLREAVTTLRQDAHSEGMDEVAETALAFTPAIHPDTELLNFILMHGYVLELPGRRVNLSLVTARADIENVRDTELKKS